MGKTRRIRSPNKKVNPLGIPSMHDATADDEFRGQEDHPKGPIAAMIEQFQSINDEEKMCGLQALSFLCQNQQKINEIIEGNLVRIVAILLMDKNKSIRNATSAALRNLSLCGIEICENLVEQDVLTPLLALLQEYATCEDWLPVINKEMNNQLDEKSDTFLQCINLLWNLCESTSIALENFNQTRILESFIKCLDYKIFGYDIAIAVSQCILVLSEDNPNVWEILHKFEFDIEQYLLKIENEDAQQFASILLRTLIVSIMSNVPSILSKKLSVILSELTKTIDIDYRPFINTITSSLPLNGTNGTTNDIATDVAMMDDESESTANLRRRKQELPTLIEMEIKNICWLLEAERIASETVTNICSIDEDSNEIYNDSDADSDKSEIDDSITQPTTNIQNIVKIPPELLEIIKSLKIIEKLWQCTQSMSVNVLDILNEHEKNLAKKIQSLRISSLLCLQNLFNVMLTEDIGGPSAIYSVWLELGKQVFHQHQDTHVLEASTALMRAALEHLRQSPDLFKQMSENDLNLMLNGVRECTEAEIRANWLRMLGILGCLLDETLVKIIIIFLLDICLHESDVWTISEALDSFMDIFAVNDWDEIVYEFNLIKRTKELEKILKSKLRQQQHDLCERYPAVCTVRSNLTRFIKYLNSQQQTFKLQINKSS